ncbi:MAG: homoserine kinase [Vicinamibacterales bacterium]
MKQEIAVPGSVGNVGPGFDTLSLAVSLYLRVRITRLCDDGRGRLITRFLDGPPLGQNRIERAFKAMPRAGRPPPSLEIEVRSEIPQRAGLGSSAAATIAGLRLRALVDGPRSIDELMSAAYRMERHPDNAASALFGGFTSSCVMADGRVTVNTWTWPRSWRLVVATPPEGLSTARSRRLLPAAIPLTDAVFNLQRLARLLAAVQSRTAADLAEAFRDRCHQPYRQPLVPMLGRLLAVEHPDVLGVCLAGAGPSVVVFARRNVAAIAKMVHRMYQENGVGCSVRTLKVHEQGDV